MDLLFQLLQPRSSRYFFVVASILVLAVVNGASWHSPGTPQHRSFPQLNSHRPASTAIASGHVLTTLPDARRTLRLRSLLRTTRIRSSTNVSQELPRIFSVLRVDSAPSRSTYGRAAIKL